MGPYPSCERAQSRTCRCTMCWGTQHGWQGAVRLAKDPDPAVRRDFREAVDESWRAAFVGKRNANQRPSQRISYPKKIAGIDSALADLVDWLAHDLATGGGGPAEPLSEAESGNRRSPGSPELPPPVTAAPAVEAAGDPAPADVRSSDRG